MEYPFSVGISSTLLTILPLTSGNPGRLRLLRERVPLLSAIVASYQVLWLGAFPGLTHRERPAQVMADFRLENKRQAIQTAPLPNDHSVQQLLGWKKIRCGPFWAVNVFRLKGL
jgi:hypothetical protein